MAKLVQQFFRRRRYGAPVVVVSGLPRSGTSMMMKMLEAGGVEIATDKIREADEDNPKGYYELERVKELDKGGSKEWVGEMRGQAVKVISFLLRDLPDDCAYKVFFMKRDLGEVMASQAKMLAHRGEPADETPESEMIEHFKDHLLRVKVMLEHRPNFEALYVPYGEAVAQPAEWARRVREFAGLDLDAEAMAAVADGRLYRNRKPAGNGAER